MKRTLTLTTPYMKGQDVNNAQWLLGHNKYGDFYDGAVDGEYGPITASAVAHTKYMLGYPQKYINNSFGQMLYDILIGKKSLPLTFKANRALRLRALKKPLKEKALALAKTQINIKESPPYSNRVKFSIWYGIIGPWCAMFVTWVFVNAGDSKIFKKGSRYAYVPFVYDAAKKGYYGLKFTKNPEAGDIVTYTIHGTPNAHIGIFDKWDRDGYFFAVEGNTSAESDADGGEVELRRRHTSQVTSFIYYPR